MSAIYHIGVVGLGSEWESRHRPALHALQDRLKVDFVYDEVLLRARQAASQFHARAPQGFRNAISSPHIDAVLFLDHQWSGLLPLETACDARKSVYLNTTLELSAAEQRRVLSLIESSQVPCMIEFWRRFAPATLRLKELIATQLGQPQLIFCHHRIATAQLGTQTRHAAIQRSLAEIFDWCRYVVDGSSESVVSVSYPDLDDPGEQQYQMLSVDFRTNHGSNQRVVAQISAGTYLRSAWPEASSFRPPAAMQVCCENGIAFVDLPNTLIWFSGAGRHMESLEGERPVGQRLLTGFHGLLQGGSPHFDCIGEFREATRVLEAARESIDQRRRIDF